MPPAPAMPFRPTHLLSYCSRRERKSTGTLTAPATGEYTLTARTGIWNRYGRVRLFLDDKELDLTGTRAGQASGGPGQPAGPRHSRNVQMQLEGARKYAVKVEYRQTQPGGSAEFVWIPPAGALLAEADKLIKDSDVAIVCVGLNSRLEGVPHVTGAL